jgi:hypothetical protein
VPHVKAAERPPRASDAPVRVTFGRSWADLSGQTLVPQARPEMAQPCGLSLRQAECPRQESNLRTWFRKPGYDMAICREKPVSAAYARQWSRQ